MRISSNPRIFPDAPGPAQAAMTLRAIRRVPGHRFFEDPLSLADNPFLEMILGPQQVTDAHLLALAAYHGARLATFDRNIVRLLPDDSGRDTLLCILTPED